jgi:hypothetical protein
MGSLGITPRELQSPKLPGIANVGRYAIPMVGSLWEEIEALEAPQEIEIVKPMPPSFYPSTSTNYMRILCHISYLLFLF